MTKIHPKIHTPFLDKKLKEHQIIQVISENEFTSWKSSQDEFTQNLLYQSEFKGKAGELCILNSRNGSIDKIIAGRSEKPSYEDGAKIHNSIKEKCSTEFLNDTSFEIEIETQSETTENKDVINHLQIGWGLNAYEFDIYKKENDKTKKAHLFLKPSSKTTENIKTMIQAVFLVRDLVNTPANHMGPEELQQATEFIAKHHGSKVTTIKGQSLVKQNFPMIYDVGKGSCRLPRLLEFSWGNKKHPKITLVGKGVCFDTGGYDIKPSQYMYNMKKDMGGAAHVLALAHMIMASNLPIYLRVLIPAVENSISGEAYRPADILHTRKGITVEIGNTDAEGRLVLADAITYACEEKPELLIDFATLTGAARVALGPDLPALFSNNEKTAQEIQTLSQKNEVNDPVWNLPLWKEYRKDIDSHIADICSTGGKAGATTAALFLNEFVEEDVEWIHLDTYAWEDNGKPARPKGGADAGLRTMFEFLKKRYEK